MLDTQIKESIPLHLDGVDREVQTSGGLGPEDQPHSFHPQRLGIMASAQQYYTKGFENPNFELVEFSDFFVFK